jgi:hypothetical protein
MKEKFRKTIIAVLAIWLMSLIGVGIFYYFVIMPQKTRLYALTARVEHEIKTNLVASHSKEKYAAELMDFKMAQARGLIADFLINKADVSNFVFDFQKMADSNGIDDFTGSHNPASSYFGMSGFESIQEGAMKLNFSGNYLHFIKMVNSLERYRPFVFVDRFDISQARRREGNCNININLIFFAATEPKRQR